MTRRCTCTTLATVLLALVVVAAGANRAGAQPPKGKKSPPPANLLVKVLDHQIDMKDFQQPMSLKDAIGLLYEKLCAEGKNFPIVVDAAAFREDYMDAPDVYQTQVRIPPFPRKMTVGFTLHLVLQNVATGDATFVVYPDRIEITTLKRATVGYKLKQPVTATFDKRKLVEALGELSAKTGASIVLDQRVGNKANVLVSATFRNDATLAGALRTLAEMAKLKVIVLDGVLFVTTPAYAAVLAKEKSLLGEQPNTPVDPSPAKGAETEGPAKLDLAAAALVGAVGAQRAVAQPPKGKKPAPAPNPLVLLLDEELDTKDLQHGPVSFLEVLGWLFGKLEARDKEFRILADIAAFEEAGEPSIFLTEIRFPDSAKKLTVAAILRTALAQAPGKNATFVVYPDYIQVTILKRTTAAYKLKQPLLATFHQRQLVAALDELSTQTATTIVLDQRVGDKAATVVSATFLSDATLAGALRTLTEMANLKVVLLDGVLFVTTPAHADVLRKQQPFAEEFPSVPGPGLPLVPLVELRQRRLEALERSAEVWPSVFVPCAKLPSPRRTDR